MAKIESTARLSEVLKRTREQINRKLMDAGVVLQDPATTYIDATVKIGKGTLIMPCTFLTGTTRIGNFCEVGPMARVHDSILEDGCKVDQSILNGARVRKGAIVGPWSRLRTGTDVGREAHVGNFCELKKAKLGRGVKMGHLAYLGDTVVGDHSNIGAGTITANYDGKDKHPTKMGKGVFTGSGTVLVAPVKMGDHSKTGAGAIVLAGHDVPKGVVVAGVPAKAIHSHKKRK